MKQINIRITDPVFQRLNALAEKMGCTHSYYVKEALLEYLDNFEDTYLASDRLEHSQKTYTLDDIEKALVLDS